MKFRQIDDVDGVWYCARQGNYLVWDGEDIQILPKPGIVPIEGGGYVVSDGKHSPYFCQYHDHSPEELGAFVTDYYLKKEARSALREQGIL